MTNDKFPINTNEGVAARYYNMPKAIINWSLCVLLLSQAALAMSGPPPEKEKPKYKIEILKMEIVTAPTGEVKPAVKTTAKTNQKNLKK